MALYAKTSSGPNIPPPPAGWHSAICYAMWDIGVQDSGHQGWPDKHQIVLSFELVQRIDLPGSEIDGMPYVQSKFFSLTISDNSNLGKIAQSWLGRTFTEQEKQTGFDVEAFVGMKAELSLIHKAKQDGTIKAVIDQITMPRPENKLVATVSKEMPKWVQQLVNLDTKEGDQAVKEQQQQQQQLPQTQAQPQTQQQANAVHNSNEPQLQEGYRPHAPEPGQANTDKVNADIDAMMNEPQKDGVPF